MRLMQRLAISGLLSVMLIVLLTGTFVTRSDLRSIVDRDVSAEERAEQMNTAWVQDKVIPKPEIRRAADLRAPRVVVNVRHRPNELMVDEPPPPVKYVVKPPYPPLDDVTNERRETIKQASSAEKEPFLLPAFFLLCNYCEL